MKKHTRSLVMLACAGLLLHPLTGSGQSYLQQTFEPGGNTNPIGTRTQLVYTATGGQTYTGTFAQATSANNANTGPLTANVFSEGTSGFGVVNNNGTGAVTSTLTFDPVSFTSTSGNYFTLRLASYRTNNNGGIDNGVTGGITNNGLSVQIAYNGSATFTNTLEVRGVNQGSVFDFNAAGVASPAAAINAVPASPTIVTSISDLDGSGNVPASGGRGTSTISISFGPAITSIQVRLFLSATSKTAIFIDDARIGSNGPLPVELTAFEALRHTNAVRLKWATASEKNSAHFEVQRSTDGRDYRAIGTVAAQGTSTATRTYSFTDATSPAGLAYYRLRQVDRDGTAAYSPVRVVASVEPVSVYPSPAHDHLTLSAAAVGQPFVVLNSLGQLLLGGTVPADGRLGVSQLPMGSYFLRLGAGPATVTQRFLRHDW